MKEYSHYQKKLIERYYDNRDDIMLSKLGEIVSELYLADSDAKAERLWKRAEKAMVALHVSENITRHILSARKPEILAHHLKTWDKASKRAKKPKR